MTYEALKLYYSGAAAKKNDTLAGIKAYLLAKHNPVLDYVPNPGHTPSNLGSKCFRKMYYNYYRVEKDKGVDFKGGLTFDFGIAVEGMVMSWLISMGEHIPYRTKDGKIPLNRNTGLPDPQFQISVKDWRINKGYIDNVAIVAGKLWLYEIKSMASYKWQELLEPLPEHKIQTGVYVKAFNDHLANGDFAHIPELKGHTKVAGVKVIYISKESGDPKLFVITPEMADRNIALIQQKVTQANKYIDAKELPPITEDKCSYCPFSKKCKKSWNLPLAD